MRTDKEMLKIFEAEPDWVFQLTGLPSPGACALRSITIKSLERTADGVIVPIAAEEPLTVSEIQFQRDERIYTRVVMEMAAIQEMHAMRPVQGVVFFGYNGMDPQPAPWTAVVRAFVLPELLEALEREQPRHPLVAVFKPLFVTSDEAVASEAADYCRAIKSSAVADDVKAVLLAVLVSWLEQRFKDKGKREIEAMLLGEFPPLEETQSGKDLIQIGEQRGEERGLQQGLQQGQQQGLEEAALLFLASRYGAAPAAIEAKIRSLSTDEAKRLLRYLYSPQPPTMEDLERWLAAPSG